MREEIEAIRQRNEKRKEWTRAFREIDQWTDEDGYDYIGIEVGVNAVKHSPMADIDRLLAIIAEMQSEYICKCGIRVTPHRCAETGGEF